MRIPSYLYGKRRSGIYCIENLLNKNRYVGSSLEVYSRLHKHRSFLCNNKHQNSYLQNAVNKYGIDNFEVYIVEFCEEKDLLEKEQYWINEMLPEYNLTKEVIRNVLSQESRDKISKTLKRKYAEGSIGKTKTSPVKVFNLKGEFVNEYLTIRECAKDIHTHVSSIIRVLTGVYHQANGYQFKYSWDDTPPLKDVPISRYTRRFYKPAPDKLGGLSETPEVVNTELSTNLND